MISVVIPLYNKEMYIRNTIENVLKQTFQNFEIVIVNDGSTDDAVSIVEEFKDKRIKLINQINKGVSSARNNGVKNASFDYIAFLDADDTWLPGHLDNLYDLIINYPDADIFATNFYEKRSNSKKHINRNDLSTGIVDNYFKNILKKNIIHTSSVCLTRKAFNTIGGFDERFSRGEDIYLWNQLARKYDVAFSSKATSMYLIDAANNFSYTLPNPDVISSYYFDLNDCINKYDKRILKKVIAKRIIRYFIVDMNWKDGCKFFKKQKKELFK